MQSFHSKILAPALALAPSLASAALISHESFTGYTAGQLTANPAPSVAGYTGNWTSTQTSNRPSAVAGSLTYGDPLYAGSSGGAVTALTSGNARATRVFDSSLVVTATTQDTRYLSFLFQATPGGTPYQALELHDVSNSDANRNFNIGHISNAPLNGTQYGFGADNLNYTSLGMNVDNGVHLFVVKFDLSSTLNSDSFTVWIDPNLGGPGDPAGGITLTGQELTWDRLSLGDFGTNAAGWDEIRWGTTFADVTTVPEPSVTFLGGLCMLGILRRRRA